MNCVQSMHHIYVNALLLFHVNILRTLSDFSFLFSSGMKRFVSQKWPPCSSLLGTIPDLAEEEIISSLNTSLFVSSPQTWRSISKHALQSCGWKMLISEIISTQLPMCTVVYVLCVVSRLQGDSLSDTRSEEEHRPHVSEQAVPDISCMLHNTAQIQYSYTYVYVFLHFCGLTCSVLFFLFVRVVWFSSIVWGGHRGGTAAGMWGHVSSVSLCKYPPYIHHQTIKIILQPSITVSLSSSAAIVSRVSEKKHLEHLFNRTGKTDPSLCGPQLIVLNKWYSNQKSPCITSLISQGHLCAILMA